MLRIAFIGLLVVLALAITVVLFRHPAPVASDRRPRMVPATNAVVTHPVIPPPRYRAMIRPEPVKKAPVEGFVRGTVAKPVLPPAVPAAKPKPAESPTPTPKAEVAKPTSKLESKPDIKPTVVSAAPAKPAKPSTAKPENMLHPAPASPRANVELGRQLLGSDGKREGRVPLISMDYRGTLGWAGYVTEMQKLGGRFFLYDPAHERVLARAEVKESRWVTVTDAELRSYSPRLRQIEDEPAVGALMAKGRKQFNVADATLILLLPLEVDFEIVGGLMRMLPPASTGTPAVARLSGNYERGGSGLQLHVKQCFDAEGNGRDAEAILPVRGMR